MTAGTPTAGTSAWPFTWETTASEVLAGVDLSACARRPRALSPGTGARRCPPPAKVALT